jgi:hypothetical protein
MGKNRLMRLQAEGVEHIKVFVANEGYKSLCLADLPQKPIRGKGMQEHLTKVELYGLAVTTEDTTDDYYKHSITAELVIKRNEKESTKTFIVLCQKTGKILVKFEILEEKCDKETG